MADTAYTSTPAPRKLWVRALMMLLMCVAFQLTAWVLLAVAVLQLLFSAALGGPNMRLQGLGRSLGRYLRQIAAFGSFACEDAPFPFSDWPSAD